MGPPIIDPNWMWRVLKEAEKPDPQQRSGQPKRPFESGRTLPRNESLERAVKRIGKLEGGAR